MSARFDNVLFFQVRHGRTAANELKVYRSWSNDERAQLAPEGRRDAEEAGEFLASTGVPIDFILADALDRTAETGEIIARVLDCPNIHLLRALHPLNMGDLTLRSKEENPVDPYLRNTSLRIPGGETVDEFDARQRNVYGGILNLVDEYPEGKGVVVGHGSNVSFLHNRMFSNGHNRIGYEGLVDPGGVVAVTPDGLLPLTKVREKIDGKGNVDDRLTEKQAGYMELAGAIKDADCEKVFVPGGVSRDRGCCNEFHRDNAGVTRFECGTCEYVKGKTNEPTGTSEAVDTDRAEGR